MTAMKPPKWRAYFWIGLAVVIEMIIQSHLHAEGAHEWKPAPDSFASLDAARVWIQDQIAPKTDEEVHGARDWWQSPQETLELRTGDCEDYAILLAYYAERLGYHTRILTVIESGDSGPGWHIDAGGHAVVEIDGLWYSPQNYAMTFPANRPGWKVTWNQPLEIALHWCGFGRS